MERESSSCIVENNSPRYMFPSDSTKILDDPEKKALSLIKVLTEDIRAADLKWSLFVAASNSFRHDTCLNPFPPNYIYNGEKNTVAVLDVLTRTVNFNSLINLLPDRSYITTHTEIIDLLFYVLIYLCEPYLKSVSSEEIESILNKAPSDVRVPRPQYIFQVVSVARSQAEMRWKDLSTNKSTFFAYHGSHLENFYSILHHGLQQDYNKKMAFGSGIYLSSDLRVSLPHSPGGFGWKFSGFSQEISCVAMCEVIDSPEGVHCHKSGLTGEIDAADYPRARANDSMAGELPHKYYLVSNNELVRVRYLLIYAKESPTYGPKNYRESGGPFLKWVFQHKLLTMVFCYSFILTLIVLANNTHLQYHIKMLMKKVEKTLNGLKF